MAGNYWLEASDNCTSVIADIDVNFKYCDYSFFAPNAFSPNGDGLNDVFSVFGNGIPEAFELVVYNRWGNLVFSSEDINTNWDGTINGRKCPVGIYTYRFQYVKKINLEIIRKEETGIIALIR